MPKAIIYVRVSSKEQKQEGYSIPAQKKLLAEYAKANDFDVVKEFEDDETAKSAGRTGFGQMIEYIKENKDVNTILVEKINQLYRNFTNYVTIDNLDVTFSKLKDGKMLISYKKPFNNIYQRVSCHDMLGDRALAVRIVAIAPL